MMKRVLLLPLLVCLAAVPAFAATVRVKADKTPLRAAPVQNAVVIDQLKAGAILDLVDVNREWYKVRDPLTKKEGYVLASAVDLQPGRAPATGGQKTAAPGAATKPVAARPVKKGDWTDRGYLFAGVLFQAGGSATTQLQTWQYFAETATTSVTFPAKSAPGVDIAGGYRVWRNLAVGVGVTSVSHSTTTTVTGSIPNPLYVNQPRTLTGGFGANTSETGIHLQATWVIPVSPKMMLMVFGGPSIFSVQQTIVQAQGIGVSSAYPYDVGVITSANTIEASKTALGFGAGADLSYHFSKTVGVGGMIRFARASASFPVTGQPSVSVDAGGIQVGVGLRVLFPSSKTAKPKTPPKAPPKPQPAPKKPPEKK